MTITRKGIRSLKQNTEQRVCPRTNSFFFLPVSLSMILAHFFRTIRVQQQVKSTVAIMIPPATCKDTQIERRPKICIYCVGRECHRLDDYISFLLKNFFQSLSPDTISWMVTLALFILRFVVHFPSLSSYSIVSTNINNKE